MMLKTFSFLLFITSILLVHGEPVEIKYAKRFEIENHKDYKVIKINNPWPKAKVTFSYVLVPEGKTVADKHSKLSKITTPIKRLVTQSTSMLPFVEHLNHLDYLVGVENDTYINNEKVLKRIKDGKVEQVGGSNNINIEKIYKLKPDAVLTYGTVYTSMNNYPRLTKSGIPNMVLATYTEETLLGRSEWIKLFGILFHKEKLANEIFHDIEKKYLEEIKKIKKVNKKPTVFSNTPYGAIWHMPSGKTWLSDTILAAGGDYLWKNDLSSMGTLKLNTETVYFKALKADIWLGPSHNRWKKYSDVLNTDERFAKFKAYKQKQIYLNNKRLNPNGGNDIYEKGMVEPHLILRDLALIMSGETKDERAFTFYQAVK